MQLENLLIFAATVLPLICTPGPDIMFVASQGLSAGKSAALRANAGVISGYCLHSILGALGVTAIVATSPILFEVIRWVGVVYLAYLAIQMFRSAMRPGKIIFSSSSAKTSLTKGFLTSFLNPKGLLIYFAILPNFITADSNYMLQSIILSAIFITTCALIYGLIGVIIASMGQKGSFSDRRRRWAEGVAAGLLCLAAGHLAKS
ncbi:amino acid transporter [Photorhabdus luminescens subsp. luminescens]|uniref:Threonine/homoserine/homoserine lactone efflux protein n=1 Tax=Photorhabdus luminescens TaxID=29488 RepID=A0A1G5RBG2_PHOLU|nr:LysE family translocator [Photorhabdus luminescens]KMW72368.1 amino acid transporter [Photorhabdus luminescens subsp. luminescens]SCZ71424.1 Threonine/homoserine/homoserine lactone efflux protein [Photorhabdus luminescens]